MVLWITRTRRNQYLWFYFQRSKEHCFFSSQRRALGTAFSQRDGAAAEAQAEAQAQAQAEAAAAGRKIHIFASHLDPFHRIQSKFGMDILLDHRNKPAKDFFIFLKIQDGRRRSKIFNVILFS